LLTTYFFEGAGEAEAPTGSLLKKLEHKGLTGKKKEKS